MCSVCGCGESRIEGDQQAVHSHSHDDAQNHSHHGHSHRHSHSHSQPHDQQSTNNAATVVHHHYYYGDVHQHFTESKALATPSHREQPEPFAGNDNNLHYGKGAAGTHVTGVSQRRLIEIERDVLDKNNGLARHNREHFAENRQLVLNLVSSPGSGKTTLLTATLMRLADSKNCAVIEGDQQTDNDAERIRQTGVAAIQVNTGKGCHLDAKMVHDAYHRLELAPDSILFIENVGNLVCPSSFDLGEKYKVAILSVTEGDDKPLKYPNMFAAAQLMVINKIDLLPYVNFDINQCIDNARKINPDIQVIQISATTGEGMEQWLAWLATA